MVYSLPFRPDNMLSIVYTTILGALATYFFYQRSYALGIVLLIVVVLRLFRSDLRRFGKALGDIAKYSDLEKRCNCALRFTIGIREVLKQNSLRVVFDKLQQKNVIDSTVSMDEWIDILLKNFQQQNATESWGAEVSFNLKNNLVWKNGEINFNDTIYHEIFIPHDLPDASRRIVLPAADDDFDRKLETSFSLSPSEYIHAGITIRIFLVNGIVKLQVGDFSKRYSPEVVREALAIYKRYETVTTFPLLYFSYRVNIPETYLNLSAYATESWYAYKMGRQPVGDENWTDWRTVVKDVADYNYLCSIADEYTEDRGKWDEITKRFDEKRTEWLNREGYKDHFARDDDYGSFYPRDDSLFHSNRYMSVYVRNFGNSDFKEGRDKYLYTDYYEERP